MRRYCLGAILLELEDPSKIIGQIWELLLEPNAEEREGDVPNVSILVERLFIGVRTTVRMFGSASGYGPVCGWYFG
nr:hypothetical protein [Desulfotalea psychrophila]